MKWEKEIRELHDGGMTRAVDIAKELNLSYESVRYKLRKMGVAPEVVLSDRANQYKKMHATGMTDRQIAEVLGASRKTVTSIRLRLKLPPNGFIRELDRDYLIREFDEQMKALQEHGEHDQVRRKVKNVAAELGANYDRLMKIYVDELGLIERRPARKYTDEQYAEAKRLLDNHGLSYTEVGKLVGIPRARLGEVFPGRGLSPSDSRSMGWVNKKMEQMGI